MPVGEWARRASASCYAGPGDGYFIASCSGQVAALGEPLLVRFSTEGTGGELQATIKRRGTQLLAGALHPAPAGPSGVPIYRWVPVGRRKSPGRPAQRGRG